MKLLIITAVEAFEKEIKDLLKKSGVLSFSYQKVIGFRDVTEEALESNWFASEMNENESVLFYAFANSESVEKVFAITKSLNENHKSLSKIHLAVVPIEQTN
uniref:hypothetical protein n=1 Tax=Flavobacterium sp. TaxID=239 RepID=UPI00404B5859